MLSSAAPLFVFGQENQDETISLQDASRFLFRNRTRTTARSFIAFFPVGKDRFRVRQADSTNPASMVKALQLPSEAPFLIADRGKRLKLTAPTSILEQARSQNLDAALVVSQQNAKELIGRFQDCNKPEEELRHKIPRQIHTGMEMAKFNAKPIVISIWDDGIWKIAERNVTYGQTEEKLGYYMDKYKGLRPFDFEGRQMSIEECFDGAQNDYPPTVYLAHPEEASALFPIEL
jgi:hypothetical protein